MADDSDDLVSYQSVMSDNSRWARFTHRPGDIIISTPPKSGTTWTQMLCALLIFDGPEFPGSMDEMSPWLDLLIRSEQEAFAVYEQQTHRRIIKTHTPLDGIPHWDDVTYLVVGRDPRDALISYEHHAANIDIKAVMGHRAAAIGNEDLADRPRPGRPDADPANRFRAFMESGATDAAGPTLTRILHHLRTGWERRDEPNVGLFHFADYRRDLVGEMEPLAEQLGIEMTRARLEELAPEAGMDRMRERAADVAPDTTKSPWRDVTKFFRTGGSGEWIARTDETDRLRYDERVRELVEPDLSAWVHGGRQSRM